MVSSVYMQEWRRGGKGLVGGGRVQGRAPAAVAAATAAAMGESLLLTSSVLLGPTWHVYPHTLAPVVLAHPQLVFPNPPAVHCTLLLPNYSLEL